MVGIRRWTAAGVAAAGVAFASLALLTTFTNRPFHSVDERQHVAYALEVARGHLPTLSTPVRPDLPGMAGLAVRCPTPAPDLSPQPRPSVAPPLARTVADTRGTTSRAGPGAVGGSRAARVRPPPRRPPTGCPRQLAASLVIYTANHPPLFYVLEAAPLRLGEAVGAPIGGLIAARVVNIAVGALGLAAAAGLVLLLAPRRADLAVATAGLVGLCGLYADLAGQVYNDVLAVATITAALAAAVAIAIRGPSPGRLVLVCAATLAAAASRASGLEVAGLIAPAVGLAVGWHRAARRAPVAAAAAGAGAALLVVGTVAAGIGWFYLRNLSLYGDLTGADVVSRMFTVRPVPWATALVSGPFWSAVYRGCFGRLSLVTGNARLAARAVLLAVPTGLVLAAARVGTRRATRARAARERPGDGAVVAGPGGPPVGGRIVVWTLIGAHVALVVVTFLWYVNDGGAAFTRYLFPVLPEAALVFATALAAFPAARLGLPTAAALGTLAWCDLVIMGRDIARANPALRHLGTLARIRTAMTDNHIGHPATVLGVLLTTLAVGLLSLAAIGARLSYATVPQWRIARAVGAD